MNPYSIHLIISVRASIPRSIWYSPGNPTNNRHRERTRREDSINDKGLMHSKDEERGIIFWCCRYNTILVILFDVHGRVANNQFDLQIG
jgi:hypothetical protein